MTRTMNLSTVTLAIVALAIVGVSCSSNVQEKKKRICYVTSWSSYRPGKGRFEPEMIDFSLCTHINYAFASVNNGIMTVFDYKDHDLMARLNKLKRNTGVRTLISVGGWNFNKYKLSQLLLNDRNRRRFVNSALSFAVRNGFDGVDLDFEYPVGEEKYHFTKLVQLMRSTFDNYCAQHGLPKMLVTAAVAAGKGNIDNGYQVALISRYLDFINVMTYDLHGGWEHFTGFVGPMYPAKREKGFQRYLNVDWVVNYWLSLGCPKHKLVIGIPLYGRGFQLANANNHYVGARSVGVSPAGRYTRESGYLAYYEICKHYEPKGHVHWDVEQKSNYAAVGTTWVGYDTPRSVFIKAKYVKDHDLGGWMVWTLAMDDFTGSFCGKNRYPLMKSLNSVDLDGNRPDGTTTTTAEIPTQSTKENGKSTTTTKNSNPTTTTFNSQDPYSGIPNRSAFCKNKSDGFYPVRSHCYVFCRCVSNVSYWFQCPSHLIFNPQHSYCDYESNITSKDLAFCRA